MPFFKQAFKTLNVVFAAAIILFACTAKKEKAAKNNLTTNDTTAVNISVPIPIWGATTPNANLITGQETLKDGIAENVATPTIQIFKPKGYNSGGAVIVMPGGGYKRLAVELEGSEICEWLATIGVTGILLKYRVPHSGPHYYEDCHCEKEPIAPLALQDAQRAMRVVRSKAKALQIDINKIGVMGFSAGGHLVADISTNYNKKVYQVTDVIDTFSCRPSFGIVMFPGHMTNNTTQPYQLNPKLPVTANTPPTFILQAGNDPIDPIENSLVYYIALQKAKVHAEYHIYAEGGHAFGLNRTVLNNPNWHKLPIANWASLVQRWLQTIEVLR
jgi:acetyl esterase/lipase